MKKFLLIDDHLVVRSGVSTMLSQLFLTVDVQEAANSDDAVIKLKQHQFDLVIMDVQIPGSNMISLMEFIHMQYPTTKVLIFSMSAENIYASRFLKAGAMGFLSKDSTFDEAKKAIELVLNNKRYISENLAQTLADETIFNRVMNPFTALSRREIQITSLMLSSQKSADLAKTLNLAASTVGTYKKRIFEKLGVNNLLELNELATTYDFIKVT